ncbi:MarR family transcriptional regulator [Shewanella sp. SG44-6]|uniref:MarR family winged helix-turn-helix transcriptional regulator n=1 Tax=Shewanella sp. SG44-6 TaxID=2760959 RepID=UPI001601BD4B|nr:MarR family transcriptional regulator [Shewanella sp. SG44-6]MBB1388438.1 MarR family transcriptional regulator [Shewanella sp. SG44-6]
MKRFESLSYLISHLNIALQQEIDTRLKRYDLDSKLWPVLFTLWQEEGLSQTELSKRCDVANYTMTRLLDHLQVQGFITRHQEADNRRAFQIFLTDNGKALQQDLLHEAAWVNERFLEALTDSEQYEFMRLLNKVNKFNQ